MSVQVHPQFLVDAEGQRQSVLISVEEYEALLDQIEDLQDAMRAEYLARTQKPEDFEDWKVVKQRLGDSGHLE